MQSSDNDNKPMPGCYAVKYDGVVWASFNKDLILEFFNDVPNINESAKHFDASPVFDDSNPLADSKTRRDLVAGDFNMKYLICDRTALEFQLSKASKTDGIAIVASEICNILVKKEEAKELLEKLLSDEDARVAERQWYEKNGDKCDVLFEETYKALGKNIGQC